MSMRFGIDLDGCLCDFTSQVIVAANTLWPEKMPVGYIPDNWDYAGMLTKDEWNQVWKELMHTENLWLGLPPLPGALQLQYFLRGRQHAEVYFVTSRCDAKGMSAMMQSTSWLEQYGLWPRFDRSTVVVVSKPIEKLQVLKDINIHFFLDDHAPTVREMMDGGINVYLLDAPYNQYFANGYAANLPRVWSVQEYLAIVEKNNAAERSTR